MLNIHDWDFRKWLKTVDYFFKNLHLRGLTGFLMRAIQHINAIVDIIGPNLLKCYETVLTVWLSVK